MRRFALALTLALAGCATGGGADKGPDEAAELSARLAGATFGRVPGQAVDCINVADIRANRALGRELILFDGPDGRQWVNRVGACPGLEYGRTIRLSAPTSRLCRGEAVQIVDPRTNQASGNCQVGSFLSYAPR